MMNKETYMKKQKGCHYCFWSNDLEVIQRMEQRKDFIPMANTPFFPVKKYLAAFIKHDEALTTFSKLTTLKGKKVADGLYLACRLERKINQKQKKMIMRGNLMQPNTKTGRNSTCLDPVYQIKEFL